MLVLGATGALGSVAVQAARLLGAGRVVAAALGGPGFERLERLGADVVVALDGPGDPVAALRDATEGGADVVVDPLWGAPALAAMQPPQMARGTSTGVMAGLELSYGHGGARPRHRAVRLRGVPRPDRRAPRRLSPRDGGRGRRCDPRGRRGGAARPCRRRVERQARGAGTKLVIVP